MEEKGWGGEGWRVCGYRVHVREPAEAPGRVSYMHAHEDLFLL